MAHRGSDSLNLNLNLKPTPMSATSPVDDETYSCGQDSFEPRPEDFALLLDKPQEAVAMFRQLFLSDDLRIVGFMKAFHTAIFTRQQLNQLWFAGFATALLDALSDRRWYDSFPRMFTNENFDRSGPPEWVRYCALTAYPRG